jgi:hypothetical protein
MTERRRLPDRRASVTIEFAHAGSMWSGTVSFFPSGDLAEVFLRSAKPNSALDILANDAAVAVSIGCRHGATLRELRHALLRSDDGSASGALGHLLDLIEGDTGG